MVLLKRTAVTVLALALPALVVGADRTVTLTIPTMDCATCPITIRLALLHVTGVTRAKVSYERREARVTFDDASTNVPALVKATTDAGYPSFEADDAMGLRLLFPDLLCKIPARVRGACGLLRFRQLPQLITNAAQLIGIT
jgi:mercuric ion binding protein